MIHVIPVFLEYTVSILFFWKYVCPKVRHYLLAWATVFVKTSD